MVAEDWRVTPLQDAGKPAAMRMHRRSLICCSAPQQSPAP